MSLQQLMNQMSGIRPNNPIGTDESVPDTAETVHISSLSLLKMLKHGRAGVPMEVMGLMLGEFVDDYTVRCIDVFAMPQSGTGVSVEAVDPVFQAKMLDMLKLTGRYSSCNLATAINTDLSESVIGWYHSHPGFGCWLSGVDMNTQQSFEQLDPHSVAVVIDPIQSVRGKVVIDAFRLINTQQILSNQEPRQTTSNVGHLQKASIQALIHGLNRHYYSLVIDYSKNELEQKILSNLNKKKWNDTLAVADYVEHAARNEKAISDMLNLTKSYLKSFEDQENTAAAEKPNVQKVAGKLDPKRHLEQTVQQLMTSNITQIMGTTMNVVTF